MRPGAVGRLENGVLEYACPGNPWYSTMLMIATHFWKGREWVDLNTNEVLENPQLLEKE